MIFAPGLQFITGRLLPLVLLNAVECERTSCEARNYCDEEEEGEEEEREGGEKKINERSEMIRITLLPFTKVDRVTFEFSFSRQCIRVTSIDRHPR